MIDNAIRTLKRKHLVIVGKTETERTSFINQIIPKVNYETFQFPKRMKSIDDYIDYVRTKNLYNPWYTKKGKFGINQVLDFHRDWISENNSLVIMEEFQEMEERWKLDLLRSYLDEVAFRKKNQKVIHLIISQENENNLLTKLSEEIGVPDDDRRTKKQIVDGGIEIIEV